MFRRCVSLLVIAGFLASHLAAIPHAHGIVSAAEQEKHDATPHFHCNWFSGNCSHSHGHSHSHDHSHGEHGHSHKSLDEHVASPEGPHDRDLGSEEHDRDAVYVAQVTASVRAEVNSQANQSPSYLVAELHEPDCNDAERAVASLIWHPPDKVRDGSSIYLNLRQLRI